MRPNYYPGINLRRATRIGLTSVLPPNRGDGTTYAATVRYVNYSHPAFASAMSFLDFLLLLIIAGICGSLAQAVAGYSRGGCLVAIVLGFIGALFGTWLARTLVLPEPLMIQIGDRQFPVVWSIVGAALFSALLSLFTRPRPVAM